VHHHTPVHRYLCCGLADHTVVHMHGCTKAAAHHANCVEEILCFSRHQPAEFTSVLAGLTAVRLLQIHPDTGVATLEALGTLKHLRTLDMP
jgi:hypothetical protein